MKLSGIHFPILLMVMLLFITSVNSGLSQDFNFPVRIKSNKGEDEFLYKREFAWGINLNTIGGWIGGVYFKNAKAINKRLYRHLSLEIVNVKHEKEIRQMNLNTGRGFILYKRNYFYALRSQFGREYVLFQKARKEGIQVNAISALGPTIGLQAPYLIEYNYTEDYSTPLKGIIVEQYDGQNPYYILGSGYLLRSLIKSKIIPGISFKAALSFEMSTFNTSASGLEVGFMFDAFSKDILILKNAPTQSVYTSVFVTFYFGIRK